MPEVVNTSFLGSDIDEVESPNEETMIKVDDVSMVFNMASETMNNLKEYFIAAARRELRFKEFRALDHVSLEVKKGDVFGILGTNGSGKSTLLKIIAGVLEPTEGTCTVNGNIAPLIELGAGFDMELTARENIYLNGALLGYPKHFIEEHFDEIVDFAEVNQFLDMPLKNYSSGMVARIAFAIATVIVPEILIVDEVLSVGDFMFQQKCERRINTLIKEHGVTVLIVSHSNDQIERLCNKAIWIEKGHERMAGSAYEVCQVYRLIGGRPGAQESEKLITDTIFNPYKLPNKSVYRTIACDNLATYAVKFAEITHPDTSNHLIITPQYGAAENYTALSLAKYYDCPILTTETDRLPDTTVQAILRLQPKQVLIIGSESSIAPSIEQDLMQHFGIFNLQRIAFNTAAEISKAAYSQLCSLGANPHCAVVSYQECVGDLNTLGGYIYHMGAPVFFTAEPGYLDDTTLNYLKSFSHVIIVGGKKQIPEQVSESLQAQNIKVDRLLGNGPFDANVQINNWITCNMDNCNINPDRTLLISSFWRAEKAFTLGVLAGKTNSIIVFDDPGELDSVAVLIRFLRKHASDFDELLFIGDEVHFNENDKCLAEKALLLGKQKRITQ